MDNVPPGREARFSVIIPTLNEEETIEACIAGIRSAGTPAEIIVSDGGSADNTVGIARELGARVIFPGAGRGIQCNAGAAAASGSILVFLHADTLLPPQAFTRLADIFRSGKVRAGNFLLRFDSSHWFLDLLCRLCRFDPGFFRFGDQGIVIRRELFDSLGGFPCWRLFEDMAFMRRVRRATRLSRFPLPVVTSARRFRQNGVFRQQLRNIYYIFLFTAGMSPEKLAARYYEGQHRKNRDCLGLFVRFPVPGRVKTRLAGAIGSEAASIFYRRCAEHVMTEAGKLSHQIDCFVFYADKSDGPSVRRWAGSRFRSAAQPEGDLEVRLKAAFDRLFGKGARKAVIAASDVPGLTAAHLEEAFAALDRADVVTGPCTDGGYYLIGLKKLYPPLFEDISWSTEEVYRQTLVKADSLGLSVYSLPPLDDIDTGEDFERWVRGESKYVRAEF